MKSAGDGRYQPITFSGNGGSTEVRGLRKLSMEIAAVKIAQTLYKLFCGFLDAGEHRTERFDGTQIELPTSARQPRVGPDAQDSGDALPATLSVKSELSVVKNRIKFLPQMAQRTQRKHKAHKQGRSVKK